MDADLARLDAAARSGFRSLEWMAFDRSPAAPPNHDWRPFAGQFAAAARDRGLRLSAIGALYRNPLDPVQTESARDVFTRAIEVAAHLGVRTVSGFPGAVIDPEINPRGGNPVYSVSEAHLPRLLEFWEPLARFAADHGVRLAFEHCPQGQFHLPVMGYNMLAQPAMWERLFNATRCENLGIEWDAAHLVCQFIDPVANLRRFGARVFHVHAKDAFINRALIEAWGLCHPGVAEHRWPGFGQSDWAQIVHELLRAGYDSDLNLEGRHDPVLRDHPAGSEGALAGRQLEEAGEVAARRWLEQFVPAEA
jgi:sugar phosphate isomerase/epimerase